MKTNIILLGIGCLLTMTGSTLSTTEGRSQGIGINDTAPVTDQHLYKKDSILNIIKQKDDVIEMKMNQLEKQLYLLRKENKRIGKLLRIKSEEIVALQDRLVQAQTAITFDSSMFLPINNDTMLPGNKPNFLKRFFNKLKHNN